MITLSKAISAGQAQAYHHAEFANAKENYYTEGDHVQGEWQGVLAERYGLRGEVEGQQFARLSEGQHPLTGEQLVHHQTARTHRNERGVTVRTMEHRAGWDATFSAPKSVSLTALVGGDDRIREAHKESVRIALDEMERFVQARIGGNAPAETSGAWVVAKFQHDSSRPVDGYAAPQLHTHAVIFNLTETGDGSTRALQPRELYRTQQYATAVYRSELAARLIELGYEIDQGEHGQPEIKGYTREYLEASSPRRQQIREKLEECGLTGAGAAQIVAHQTRDAKQALSREAVRLQHQQLAAEYGNQPERVLATVSQRSNQETRAPESWRTAKEAITFASERSMERTSVADERELMRDALRHSMGVARLPEIRAEFERRLETSEFVEVACASGHASRAFTTTEMQSLEREIIEQMRAGQASRDVLVSGECREWAAERHSHLSESQQTAVNEVLTSRDRLMGLEGLAGAGKTTSLAAIREAAELGGYEVQGLAPTSRAAQKLAEAGMKTETLQRHLTRAAGRDDGQSRLYIVDESSMASTRQMHAFISNLKHNDRVLFVGDTRQHEAVEAGRPYAQLLEAGMLTARLEVIVRQHDPALKAVVGQLARGEVEEAVASLQSHGRVHEVYDRQERIDMVAQDYARKPENTLVVSPDNHSRREINTAIHKAMQASGHVSNVEQTVRVLQTRQELTGVDRQNAASYEPEDVIRFTKGSKVLGVNAGEYAKVIRPNQESNTLTVAREDGETLTYDPRRLQGVTVYREMERKFAAGDRVQLTAPDHPQKLANRELGTIEQMDAAGNLKLKMDSGRMADFDTNRPLHLDYGYAVTSHSSQGQTADRVLIHIDSEQAHGQLLNSRMAYVSVSRARHDVQIYTNDAGALGQELSREVSHLSALQPEPQTKEITQIAQGISIGL